MNSRESVLIDMLCEVKNELKKAKEEAKESENYYNWAQQTEKDNDELLTKIEALETENAGLKTRLTELELQLEELSQAKAPVIMTDTAAKGVL